MQESLGRTGRYHLIKLGYLLGNWEKIDLLVIIREARLNPSLLGPKSKMRKGDGP